MRIAADPFPPRSRSARPPIPPPVPPAAEPSAAPSPRPGGLRPVRGRAGVWRAAAGWEDALLGPNGPPLARWRDEGRLDAVKRARHRTVWRLRLGPGPDGRDRVVFLKIAAGGPPRRGPGPAGPRPPVPGSRGRRPGDGRGRGDGRPAAGRAVRVGGGPAEGLVHQQDVGMSITRELHLVRDPPCQILDDEPLGGGPGYGRQVGAQHQMADAFHAQSRLGRRPAIAVQRVQPLQVHQDPFVDAQLDRIEPGAVRFGEREPHRGVRARRTGRHQLGGGAAALVRQLRQLVLVERLQRQDRGDQIDVGARLEPEPGRLVHHEPAHARQQQQQFHGCTARCDERVRMLTS